MQKRSGLTFFIAAFTACTIIAFQLYWVYNNYTSTRQIFTTTAVSALEKSIQTYQLQQINLPTSLNAKQPTLTVFMRTIPNMDPIALDTPKSTKRFSAEFGTVAIDKQNDAAVRSLIARLMVQQQHKPLDIKALTTIYKKELFKNGIDMPVSLFTRRSPASVMPGEIAASVSFYKAPLIVYANLNAATWLLRHILLPAIVSLLLILLSAGCLWYMGVIIRRQLRLDRLKNEFINNITHELRTPMTILRSTNEAIARFGVTDDPEKLARYTGINFAILDKLENEVERMLDLSSPASPGLDSNLELIDVPDLITRIIHRFDIAGDGRIKVSYSSLTVPTRSDEQRLDTIISNLIDNAIKYAGPEAHILIEAKDIKNGWQLVVRDDGHGIGPKDIPYLFDKFYRVDTGDRHEVKGYGLGLSHVKQLVELLQGTIRVQSKPELGTTFEIDFRQYE